MGTAAVVGAVGARVAGAGAALGVQAASTTIINTVTNIRLRVINLFISNSFCFVFICRFLV